MIYIPIFVNIVLLLLFDYRHLSFSLILKPLSLSCRDLNFTCIQRLWTTEG